MEQMDLDVRPQQEVEGSYSAKEDRGEALARNPPPIASARASDSSLASAPSPSAPSYQASFLPLKPGSSTSSIVGETKIEKEGRTVDAPATPGGHAFDAAASAATSGRNGSVSVSSPPLPSNALEQPISGISAVEYMQGQVENHSTDQEAQFSSPVPRFSSRAALSGPPTSPPSTPLTPNSYSLFALADLALEENDGAQVSPSFGSNQHQGGQAQRSQSPPPFVASASAALGAPSPHSSSYASDSNYSTTPTKKKRRHHGMFFTRRKRATRCGSGTSSPGLLLPLGPFADLDYDEECSSNSSAADSHEEHDDTDSTASSQLISDQRSERSRSLSPHLFNSAPSRLTSHLPGLQSSEEPEASPSSARRTTPAITFSARPGFAAASLPSLGSPTQSYSTALDVLPLGVNTSASNTLETEHSPSSKPKEAQMAGAGDLLSHLPIFSSTTPRVTPRLESIGGMETMNGNTMAEDVVAGAPAGQHTIYQDPSISSSGARARTSFSEANERIKLSMNQNKDLALQKPTGSVTFQNPAQVWVPRDSNVSIVANVSSSSTLKGLASANSTPSQSSMIAATLAASSHAEALNQSGGHTRLASFGPGALPAASHVLSPLSTSSRAPSSIAAPSSTQNKTFHATIPSVAATMETSSESSHASDSAQIPPLVADPLHNAPSTSVSAGPQNSVVTNANSAVHHDKALANMQIDADLDEADLDFAATLDKHALPPSSAVPGTAFPPAHMETVSLEVSMRRHHMKSANELTKSSLRNGCSSIVVLSLQGPLSTLQSLLKLPIFLFSRSVPQGFRPSLVTYQPGTIINPDSSVINGLGALSSSMAVDPQPPIDSSASTSSSSPEGYIVLTAEIPAGRRELAFDFSLIDPPELVALPASNVPASGNNNEDQASDASKANTQWASLVLRTRILSFNATVANFNGQKMGLSLEVSLKLLTRKHKLYAHTMAQTAFNLHTQKGVHRGRDSSSTASSSPSSLNFLSHSPQSSGRSTSTTSRSSTASRASSYDSDSQLSSSAIKRAGMIILRDNILQDDDDDDMVDSTNSSMALGNSSAQTVPQSTRYNMPILSKHANAADSEEEQRKAMLARMADPLAFLDPLFLKQQQQGTVSVPTIAANTSLPHAMLLDHAMKLKMQQQLPGQPPISSSQFGALRSPNVPSSAQSGTPSFIIPTANFINLGSAAGQAAPQPQYQHLPILPGQSPANAPHNPLYQPAISPIPPMNAIKPTNLKAPGLPMSPQRMSLDAGDDLSPDARYAPSFVQPYAQNPLFAGSLAAGLFGANALSSNPYNFGMGLNPSFVHQSHPMAQGLAGMNQGMSLAQGVSPMMNAAALVSPSPLLYADFLLNTTRTPTPTTVSLPLTGSHTLSPLPASYTPPGAALNTPQGGEKQDKKRHNLRRESPTPSSFRSPNFTSPSSSATSSVESSPMSLSTSSATIDVVAQKRLLLLQQQMQVQGLQPSSPTQILLDTARMKVDPQLDDDDDEPPAKRRALAATEQYAH